MIACLTLAVTDPDMTTVTRITMNSGHGQVPRQVTLISIALRIRCATIQSATCAKKARYSSNCCYAKPLSILEIFVESARRRSMPRGCCSASFWIHEAVQGVLKVLRYATRSAISSGFFSPTNVIFVPLIYALGLARYSVRCFSSHTHPSCAFALKAGE